MSGGCHRAATGNISIFAGCDRPTFERVLPLLTVMGRDVLHTGELGTASTLKVMTNYLATANLLALTEALTTMAAAGVDLATTYEAIRISSGNSFVHETESQLILNGSRDIGFTIDLVLKDIGLFQSIADRSGVPLELNPLMIAIFADGRRRYGGGEWSDEIVRRLEEATGLSITAPGFPAELVDNEPEVRGAEVRRERAVRMYRVVPSAGFEPAHTAPEADALSPELRGRGSHQQARCGTPNLAGGLVALHRADSPASFRHPDGWVHAGRCGRRSDCRSTRRRRADTPTGESKQQRLDREHEQLFNELRSIIPGVQIQGAFLLTVAFTQRFQTSERLPARRLLRHLSARRRQPCAAASRPPPSTGCSSGATTRRC